MGVATGYGCKEVYRFSHTTYPYSSCFCYFLQQHPYFLFIFFVLVPVLFVITFYVLTLSRATSHYCTTRAPLERATSHYCTTGSRGLFTAYLDLLVLRFSVHCSSTASIYILFHHHVYIFTYVSLAVRKTCLFVPRTCCDASTCHRHALGRRKNDFIRVRRLFKKWTSSKAI